MKKITKIFLVATILLGLNSCDKFLDVNTNPNNPQEVEAALQLAPMTSYLAQAYVFDSRYIGRYVQNFHFYLAGDVWDFQSYVRNSDAGAQLWRDVYWHAGLNLSNLLADAQAGEKWDYYGVGLLMRAYGWQMLTDIHGELVISEAFIPNKTTFKYDSQEFAYQEVVKLTNEAIASLQRTDGAVAQAALARGDLIYAGDRSKWIKFANALLAINASHLTNKASYNPDQVIAYVDASFASNADDALVPFNGTTTVDANVLGPLRGNWQSYGQSSFIANLMGGNNTAFPGVRDPRIGVFLSPSTDGIYRGITLGQGQATSVPEPQRVRNLLNTPLTATNVQFPAGTTGKYMFADKAKFPLVTYAQLQFIKAEAAFRKGDRVTALTAYRNGISASIDFANSNLNSATAISATDKTAFLTNPIIVPINPGDLTLSKILLQKYIAQFGYGNIEQWCDLRRFNYDPATFVGLTPLTIFQADNNGKPVQRLRPRYNSEYLWNIDALNSVGGFDLDYHTKPMWFTQP